MTTTFRRGSDFRAYVQDSLAAQGKSLAGEKARKPVRRDWVRPWKDKIGALFGGPERRLVRERLAEAEDKTRAAIARRLETARALLSRPAAPSERESETTDGERQRRARIIRRDLESSRREIEAVQSRLDRIPPRPELDEQWTAALAREYRREFHPIESARADPQALQENRSPADGAAAAVFVAGKTAWHIGRVLEPMARFAATHSAPILKVAAVGLVVVGAGGLIAQWPEKNGPSGDETAGPSPAPSAPAAPRAAWIEIQKPLRLYDLGAPQLAREKKLYAARRHNSGGGREDALTFGEFAGAGPFLRLSVYRHGAEKSADAAFFVDMARRAAPLGLSLGRTSVEQSQATRFGDFETAALTMTTEGLTRDNCRGFRFSAGELGLTIAGFACAGGDEALTGGDLACLVNRLDLVSAGDDRPLRDFFAAAQGRDGRATRGCPEPLKPRATGKGLQENRVGGVF